MSSEPSNLKPSLQKKSRHTGCFLTLLVPVLLLGFLCTFLLTGPGVSPERVKASRDARERILAKRISSRRETALAPTPESSTQAAPDASSEPPSASISPEEARFWGKAWSKLLGGASGLFYSSTGSPMDTTWCRLLPWGYEIFSPLTREDLVADSGGNPWKIAPEKAKSIERQIRSFNRNRVDSVFEEIRQFSSQRYEQQDINLIARGEWAIQTMDRIERFTRKIRSPGTNTFSVLQGGDDSIFPADYDKVSLAYLITFRALQNKEPDRAAEFIERYVELAGEVLFFYLNREDFLYLGPVKGGTPAKVAENLERFLCWVAVQPQIPDETLERVAATLASWELTPQEYADLRTANLIQYREALVAQLKPALDSGGYRQMNGWHYFFSGTPEQVSSHAIERLLWRAVDRKTAALIQQDEAEYKQAHHTLQLAFLAMNIEKIPTYDGSYSVSYGDLLLKNGLELDWDGDSLSRRKRFCQLQEGSPPIDRSAFAWMGLSADIQAEQFNLTLEMVRFAFASARYRRAHGRYPESVRDLIPRYLDDSFAPNEERFWCLTHIEPFNAVVLQNAFEEETTSFSQVLERYIQAPENAGKLPASAEDLKPYASPEMDLTPFGQHFVRIEEPVFGLVFLKAPSQHPPLEATGGRGPAPSVRPDETVFLYRHFVVPPWGLDTLSPPPSRK